MKLSQRIDFINQQGKTPRLGDRIAEAAPGRLQGKRVAGARLLSARGGHGCVAPRPVAPFPCGMGRDAPPPPHPPPQATDHGASRRRSGRPPDSPGGCPSRSLRAACGAARVQRGLVVFAAKCFAAGTEFPHGATPWSYGNIWFSPAAACTLRAVRVGVEFMQWP